MEWISVKDRLPEKDGKYLVYEKKPPHAHNAAAYNYPHSCCEPNVAYFNKYCTGWQWDSFSDKECNPTHFMPLPEPPK